MTYIIFHIINMIIRFQEKLIYSYIPSFRLMYYYIIMYLYNYINMYNRISHPRPSCRLIACCRTAFGLQQPPDIIGRTTLL